MEKEKFKPVLLRDQAALAVVYERAAREHRTMANAAAAAIIETATTPQRRSFKQEIIEKSIPNLENG